MEKKGVTGKNLSCSKFEHFFSATGNQTHSYSHQIGLHPKLPNLKVNDFLAECFIRFLKSIYFSFHSPFTKTHFCRFSIFYLRLSINEPDILKHRCSYFVQCGEFHPHPSPGSAPIASHWTLSILKITLTSTIPNIRINSSHFIKLWSWPWALCFTLTMVLWDKWKCVIRSPHALWVTTAASRLRFRKVYGLVLADSHLWWALSHRPTAGHQSTKSIKSINNVTSHKVSTHWF